MIERSDWVGCYKQGWGKSITRDSYDHPAKARFGLAKRIYEHIVEEGWVSPGDCVIDPFAGIAGFGFHAMFCGLNWVGVELEPRFVKMGQDNIGMWEHKYNPSFSMWGKAAMLQGDSRNLVNILRNNADIKVCVSSPPFVSTSANGGWQMLGDYASRGVLTVGQVKGDKSKSYPSWDKERDTSYGKTDGQLASMKDKGFDAAVSSPPFCDSAMTKDKKFQEQVAKDRRGGSRLLGGEYGETDGQMGNLGDEDSFWSASRKIIEQTHEVLRPGGHAVWVCKRFVRKGKLVHFPRMWAKVCESVGFRVVHWHRAWQIEHYGTQYDLFGGKKDITIRRASFFRRLAEKKGSPPIRWEDIICCERT